MNLFYIDFVLAVRHNLNIYKWKPVKQEEDTQGSVTLIPEKKEVSSASFLKNWVSSHYEYRS